MAGSAWLVEGFTNYVALCNTGEPSRTTLGRAIAAVRDDGSRTVLPSATDVGTWARDVHARYEEALLPSGSLSTEWEHPGR